MSSTPRAAKKRPAAAAPGVGGVRGSGAARKRPATAQDGKLAAPKLARGDKRVHVLHFNDVYNLEPMYKAEPRGGAARFMTVVKELVADLHPAKPIIVFSGDFVGPSLMSTITHGAHILDMFNLLNVDYGTFGNHEFDYGYPSLLARLAGDDLDEVEQSPASRTVWINSNISDPSGEPAGGAHARRYALVERDGVKVGIFAVSNNWLTKCSQLAEGELVYEDYIDVAKRYVALLREQGAEVLLALTHMSTEYDRKLSEAVPEIDLVLGGHDHHYKRDRRMRIVKGGEEWRWLNHVTAEIDSVTRAKDIWVQRYDVDSDIAEDAEALSLLAKYKRIEHIKYKEIIATSEVDLDATEAVCRFEEGALTNWVCDAMSEDYSRAEGLQSADFAMIMGSAVQGKKKFPAGAITMGDIFTMFPLPFPIMAVKLSGRDVVRSLALGCQSLPRECGSLHHCSSRLRYTIELVDDPHVENRVTNVQFDGEPIEEDRIYTVAVSVRIAKGKFGYTWMADAERVVDEEHAWQIQNCLVQWCKRHTAPIKPSTDRITIVRRLLSARERDALAVMAL